MKTAEKELTRENLESYNKEGFITREKIVSKTREEVISESKSISKNYHNIDWKSVFEGDNVHKKTVETGDYINYVLIDDKDLGVFKINDMGENYIIFCRSIWTEENKSNLISRLKKHGIVCEVLNKNLINVKKSKNIIQYKTTKGKKLIFPSFYFPYYPYKCNFNKYD